MTDLRTKPADKDALIASTSASWSAFTGYVDALELEQWTDPVDAAGWTAKDHVSHVTAWDQATLGRLREGISKQQVLGVSDAAWTAGGWDAMNEEIRQQYIDDAVETVRTHRDKIWAGVIALVEGYSEADLAGPATAVGLNAGDATLLEALDEEFSVHYDEHLGYIKRIVEGGAA